MLILLLAAFRIAAICLIPSTCVQGLRNNFTVLYNGYFADQMETFKNQSSSNAKFFHINSNSGLQSLITMDASSLGNKDSFILTFGKDLSVLHGQQNKHPRSVDFKDSLDSLVGIKFLNF